VEARDGADDAGPRCLFTRESRVGTMFGRRPPEQRPVMNHDRAKRAVVQVGNTGRGLMRGRYIVTAASCLPHFSAFKPFEFGTFICIRKSSGAGHLGNAFPKKARR
jgi:hypothetical protein